MSNKKTIYHFILDSSGSMENCRAETITSFNSQLETIQKLQKEFPDQTFHVSLTTFSDLVEHQIREATVNDFRILSMANYRPGGSTALLDAIGESINLIRMNNESDILKNRTSVVVLILTDGQENASQAFTYHQITNTIAELEASEKWSFSFLGADIDALHTSKMLNIKCENVISFSKGDMNSVFKDVNKGLESYAKCKSEGTLKNGIFDSILNKDRRR
jgi:hypothetical protein